MHIGDVTESFYYTGLVCYKTGHFGSQYALSSLLVKLSKILLGFPRDRERPLCPSPLFYRKALVS